MILDTTTKSIQVVLAAAATTNQPSFSASYADLTTSTFTPAANDGTANGTTPVTMIAAPAASTQRQLKNLTIYNADTVNATVSVQLVDGANTRTLYKATLVSGASLQWTPDAGFTIPQTLTSNTPDFISGLKMVWNSATSISVSSGEAWIPGVNALVQPNASLTLSGLSLSASTFYHVYLYLNAGTPAIECVATAPAAPYFGTARAKTGDTSRRYVGSVKTDGSGNVLQFQHDARNSKISYLGTDYLPRNILSFGKATSTTNISCAAIIPVTAISIDILLTNADASATAETSNSSAALPMGSLTGHSYFGYASPNSGVGIPNHPVDSSLQINYMNLSTSTGGLYIDLNGYAFER